jgi:thiazole synthase
MGKSMEANPSPTGESDVEYCPTRYLSLSGVVLDRFWHCFGTEKHRAPIDLIIELLRTSGTNILPINTHHLDERRDRSALEHGFAGVRYDALGERMDLSRYIKMLNINLRTTADEAVKTAKIAFDMTGERVIKLEVLQPRLRRSCDHDVVEAARRLIAWEPSLVVLPLMSCSVDTANAAVDAGCPLLRVMGSPISSGNGIAAESVFAEICSLPIPVVLDGGIGQTTDIERAAALGADGVLINSVLFETGRPPVAVMAEFAGAARQTFELSFAG